VKWCITKTWCTKGCESGTDCPDGAPTGVVYNGKCISECPDGTFLENGECKDKALCVDRNNDGVNTKYFYDAANKTCDFYCHTEGMYADMASTGTTPRMCIS